MNKQRIHNYGRTPCTWTRRETSGPSIPSSYNSSFNCLLLFVREMGSRVRMSEFHQQELVERQNRTLTKILQRTNFHLPWHCLVYDLRLGKWMFIVTDFNWRPESSQVMKESWRCQGPETRDDQKINSSTYVRLRDLSVRGSEKRNPSIESREFIEHHVARPFHRYSMESFMRGRVYAGSSSVFGDPTAG